MSRPSDTTDADRSEDATVFVPSAPEAPERPVPAEGDRVGRYIVIEAIGEGGMGEVARAYDPKLRREVALKRVRKALLEPDGEARLVREAQAMAQLSHPNVVAVHDVDVEGGLVVIAMEYVRGQTLKRWLAGDRPWRQIVGAFRQAGRGLAAAHGVDLVHRDFKPANVLVGEPGTGRDDRPEPGAIKVTDFGLAKPTGSASDDTGGSSTSEVDLTAVGQVMGTPRYMAPEQIRGEPVDARADQYAFCVALWEALTGAPPFPGRDTAAAKTRGPPAWPRPPGVPARIGAAITRGLSPDPAERFASMDALLEQLMVDTGRSRRWIAGAGLVVGAGALLLATRNDAPPPCQGAREQLAGVWDDDVRARLERSVLGTDVAFAPATWARLRGTLDAYADAWTRTHIEACEATTVRGEQSPALMDLRMTCLARARGALEAANGIFEDADARVVEKALDIASALPRLSACDDADALRAEVPEPDDPATREALGAARIALATARALRVAGKYEQAHHALEPLQGGAEALKYPPHRAEVAWELGRVLDARGRYDDALQQFRDAMRESLQHGTALTAAGSAASLTRVLADRLGRIHEGQWIGEVALSLADRVDDPLAKALTHNHYGSYLEAAGQWRRAEDHYRKSLALREAALGPEHPLVATSHNAIGNALQQQGDLVAAQEEYRTAMRLLEASLGPEHPEISKSLNNLAAAFARQGKLEEAEAKYRRSLALQERVLGRDHPNYPVTRSNLGALLSARGQHAEALEQYRIALELMQASHGPDHPDVARAHNNLGVALHLQERYAEAAVEYREALRVWSKTLGPDHLLIATTHHNLGGVYEAQHDYAEAREHLERAWTLREHAVLAPADRGGTAFALATVLWALGQERSRALALAREARAEYERAGEAHATTLANVRTWLTAHDPDAGG